MFHCKIPAGEMLFSNTFITMLQFLHLQHPPFRWQIASSYYTVLFNFVGESSSVFGLRLMFIFPLLFQFFFDLSQSVTLCFSSGRRCLVLQLYQVKVSAFLLLLFIFMVFLFQHVCGFSVFITLIFIYWNFK